MKRGCLLILAAAVLIAVVLLFARQGHEQPYAAPVSYAELDASEQDDVPAFASCIRRASYAHWQVGEWAWCFDVPAAGEELLKQWLAEKGGAPRNVAYVCKPYHLSPPDWWCMPPDARLVSNRDLGGVYMSMWYSAMLNRVWVLYVKK